MIEWVLNGKLQKRMSSKFEKKFLFPVIWTTDWTLFLNIIVISESVFLLVVNIELWFLSGFSYAEVKPSFNPQHKIVTINSTWIHILNLHFKTEFHVLSYRLECSNFKKSRPSFHLVSYQKIFCLFPARSCPDTTGYDTVLTRPRVVHAEAWFGSPS